MGTVVHAGRERGCEKARGIHMSRTDESTRIKPPAWLCMDERDKEAGQVSTVARQSIHSCPNVRTCVLV